MYCARRSGATPPAGFRARTTSLSFPCQPGPRYCLQMGRGAQRWIDLGVIQLQPSALMNVAMVLALSRYFHSLSDEDVGRIRYWILPGLMVLVPAALVLKQPDLGTATLLLMGGASLFFIAGMPL